MTSEFHSMTAPYECYLAPGGEAEFIPATLTEKPSSPWVLLEAGEIAQGAVKIMWDRTVEEEEPAQNDSISTRVYVTKRSFAVSFSMKHISCTVHRKAAGQHACGDGGGNVKRTGQRKVCSH